MPLIVRSKEILTEVLEFFRYLAFGDGFDGIVESKASSLRLFSF